MSVKDFFNLNRAKLIIFSLLIISAILANILSYKPISSALTYEEHDLLIKKGYNVYCGEGDPSCSRVGFYPNLFVFILAPSSALLKSGYLNWLFYFSWILNIAYLYFISSLLDFLYRNFFKKK